MAKKKNNLLIIGVIILIIFLVNQGARKGVIVVRLNAADGSDFYDEILAPGSQITITYLNVGFVQGEGWAIEEILPQGWTELNGEGVVNSQGRVVIREYTTLESLTYTYVVPNLGVSSYYFDGGSFYLEGTDSFYAFETPLVRIAEANFADTNGDYILSNEEFVAFVLKWKQLQYTNQQFVEVYNLWKTYQGNRYVG